MNYTIYHQSQLKIKKGLIGNSIILKTPEIKKILKEVYGTTEVEIADETKLKDAIRLATSNDRLLEYFKEGQNIYDQLLEPLKRFLEDLALSLSMYDNTKLVLNTISEENFKKRTPIDCIPQHQFQKLPLLYAHAFLDATAKISSTLSLMVNDKKTPLIPEEIRAELSLIKKEFDIAFPEVKNIRNSWQHIEDRVRGKGPYEKSMGGGMLLVLSSLFNDELTYTVVDGSTQSISINKFTFELIQSYIQKTFNCIDWIQGIPR